MAISRAISRIGATRPLRSTGMGRRMLPGVVCCALGLAGCASPLAVGPDYTAPAAAALLPAERWQAALPHDGESRALLDWWKSFNDPTLDALLAHAEADSPTLAEAVARIDEARSLLTGAGAPHWPNLNVAAYTQRNNGSAEFPMPAQTTRGISVDAQWEIDLFGHVRRATEAATARLESRQRGWHAARISLAAEVANRYVSYRACELTLRAVAADLKSREETARITALAVQGGISAPADAQLARAGAADTASYHAGQQAACAIARKSLVTLTGLPEEQLTQLLARGTDTLPSPGAFRVDSLPVALLAQRPDLAAAERELAAANADVGSAAANRYPRLALVGNLTRDKSGAADGPDVLSKPWYFGPSLTLPLFNGGALAAQQDAAQARHAQAYARYRQAVRGAIEEVETALVNLDAARSRNEQARVASEGFRAYFLAAEQNWRAGGISLLALEDARRQASAAERNEIALQRDRILYWIALYKALGGGWQAAPTQQLAASAMDTEQSHLKPLSPDP